MSISKSYNHPFKTPMQRLCKGIGSMACKSVCLFLLLLVGCSTQKAKWSNVQYHNTTCHYNVWWNGNESLKAGREKLYQTATDDYSQIISVEKLGNEATARSVSPEMDRAIEKGIKGIRKHSIYVKGEEHVAYIKECYLLTAYATFYEQDYVSTNNTCNILVSQFAGTRAADEGAVLLARCMTAERRFTEAETTLDQLVQNLAKGNFNRKVRLPLYMAMVEATVPQEKYKKAVEYIHLALDLKPSRETKARLYFIMAQIYQQLDRRPVAAKYYAQAAKYSKEYVMEFNARLGEASCADLEHSDLQKLERQLDKMLSDKKNLEYRDQIYYAKGEMYMGMKNADKACTCFRRSVALSKSHQGQRAKSAIRLGEVLYELYEDYDQAQLYYDTALRSITPLYPHYSSIKRRADMLTELVSFTRVYTRCDSLLTVAAMPEEQRMTLIKNTIDTLVKHEQEARERAMLEELQNENRAMSNTLKGDWYFYNENTLQRGRETFRQKWGMRALEDFWFLSHKEMMGMGMIIGSEPEEEQAEEGADSLMVTDSIVADTLALGDPSDPHSIAYYLKDLPTTPRQFDSIDSLTSLNLLGAGYIFYDGVQNIDRALECYLRLSNDYTTYPEVVQAFYMLYRIFDRQGNTPQSNYYRDMVLMGFPDSDFANLIRDNEYYKELKRREGRIQEDYDNLYAEYVAGHLRRTISMADEAKSTYGNVPDLYRFDYWKAMAQAQTGDRTGAIATLEGILATASKRDSIVPYVQSQLEMLKDPSFGVDISQSEQILADSTGVTQRPQPRRNTPTKVEEEEDLPEAAKVFRYRQNQQYYVAIIINDKTIKATELQYKLSDFNSQYYSNKGYKVNASLFSDTTQIITVHRFVSADEAMLYYRHLQGEESPLRQYADTDHTEFAISTQNYATFYNRKDVEAYLAFFKKYHLK